MASVCTATEASMQHLADGGRSWSWRWSGIAKMAPPRIYPKRNKPVQFSGIHCADLLQPPEMRPSARSRRRRDFPSFPKALSSSLLATHTLDPLTYITGRITEGGGPTYRGLRWALCYSPHPRAPLSPSPQTTTTTTRVGLVPKTFSLLRVIPHSSRVPRLLVLALTHKLQCVCVAVCTIPESQGLSGPRGVLGDGTLPASKRVQLAVLHLRRAPFQCQS